MLLPLSYVRTDIPYASTLVFIIKIFTLKQQASAVHHCTFLLEKYLLMKGGSRLAQQVIVKRRPEDDGFISFEEAIKCTKNEDRTLSPLLHGAFIQLMRGLLETLESSNPGIQAFLTQILARSLWRKIWVRKAWIRG